MAPARHRFVTYPFTLTAFDRVRGRFFVVTEQTLLRVDAAEMKVDVEVAVPKEIADSACFMRARP